MKYLKYFTESNETNMTLLKDFFRDKIDFKFIEYVSYISTKYEDMGYDATIEVSVGDFEQYMQGYDEKWCSIFWNDDYSVSVNIDDDISYSKYEEIVELYDKYGLVYAIQISGNDNDIERYSQILDEIVNKVSEKYKIEDVSHYKSNSFIYFKLISKI